MAGRIGGASRLRKSELVIAALFLAALLMGTTINAVIGNGSGLLDYYYGGGPPPSGTPSVPLNLTGSGFCGGIDVSWNAPIDEGASPIQGYLVSVFNGGQLVTLDSLGPTATSDEIVGLNNGTHYGVNVAAFNTVGAGPATQNVTVTPHCIPTSLLYTGQEYVSTGSPLVVSAVLSSTSAACYQNQPISFSLDTNPITQVLGTFPLTTINTDATGNTPPGTVNTTGWQEGVYLLTSSFAGTKLCAPAQDQEAIVVAGPADAASGGGWITDNGRTSFAFEIHLVPNTTNTYTGQFLIMNNGKWKMKGTLTTYSVNFSVGTVAGTGNLFFMNSTGGWSLAQSGVGITLRFTASGSGKKAAPGSISINIAYTPQPPQPSSLPNIGLTPLKGGHIQMR